MSTEFDHATRLANMDRVVQGYLETLLSEAEVRPESAPTEPRSLSKGASSAPGIGSTPVLSSVSQSVDPEQASERTAGGAPDQRESSLPEWAARHFQALLFDVAGVSLAVPLISLSGILKWSGERSVLPGQPDWHLGVFVHNGRRVGIVDTARIVMPERVAGAPPAGRLTQGHLLLFGEGRWGLRCDHLSGALEVENTDVRWRSWQGQRPCLAGTIVDRLCMLLDVEAVYREIGHE